MLPARRRSMPRSAGRAVKNAPVRFVSMTAPQSSALIRTARPSRVMPAFSTRASSGPSASSTASTRPAACASSATSAAWAWARRPAASTAATVAAAPSASAA